MRRTTLKIIESITYLLLALLAYEVGYQRGVKNTLGGLLPKCDIQCPDEMPQYRIRRSSNPL